MLDWPIPAAHRPASPRLARAAAATALIVAGAASAPGLAASPAAAAPAGRTAPSAAGTATPAVRTAPSAAGTATPAVRAAQAAAGAPVTFTREIAPILYAHCAGCHRPGAAAPFSLLTYAEVRPWARAIREATRTRAMPPWKPAPGRGGPFVGDRRLPDADIALIARWVDAGAPEGDPAPLPPRPAWPEGWRLGRPDLVVEMPEPYLLPPGDRDVFRKFAIPIPAAARRYVRGVEFQPGNAAVVHHANLRIDRTGAARRLDEADPAPGYAGITPFAAQYPDGYFLGWTPGQTRPLAADGMAWRLHPGSDLLLELHLMPGPAPAAVQSRVGFFFTDTPPARTPFTIRLGRQHLDIPPGEAEYVSRDRYVLPVDVDVHGVQPHAHYLAREVTGRAILPDGTTRWLIHIPDWDFDWQDAYRYVDPIVLPRGTVLTMTFRFDNSAANRRNPHAPPRRVTWGQQSTNEMGDLWIQVTPRTPADRAVLERDRRRIERAEDVIGFEKMIEIDPDQPMVRDELALLHLRFGRGAEALAHFEATARLRPASAAAQFNVGTTLFGLGRTDEAMGRFEAAIRLDPAYAPAYTNLGAALRAVGRPAAAARHFRRAVALRPDDGEALYNLAGTLALLGDAAAAAPIYRRAIARQPDAPEPRAELAWLLATAPAADPADARDAVALAEAAARLTAAPDVRILDSLAAAYAAAGRFADAIRTARAALAAAPAGRGDITALIRDRLARYEAGQPYHREPPAGAGSPR